MPSFYRPKYCCECGEKITRAEWRPFESRQFCDLCTTEHQVTHYLTQGSLFLLPIILVGLVSYAFVGERNRPEPDNRRSISSPLRPAVVDQPPVSTVRSKSDDAKSSGTEKGPVDAMAIEKQRTGAEQASRSQTEIKEQYICGAPTKKGTPCSRKVSVRGYCWQHREKTD